MVYLNDTDTGYTDFISRTINKGKTGKLVIYEYILHIQKIAGDLKEDKYIITGWLEIGHERDR